MQSVHRALTLGTMVSFLVLFAILCDQRERISHDFNLIFSSLADGTAKHTLAQEELSALRERVKKLEGSGEWHRHSDGRWWGFFIGDHQLGCLDSRTTTWRRYDDITDIWGKPERLAEHDCAPTFMEYEE